MNKVKGEKGKNMRNKGITLIALVITIIVLLILAGVSIATLTGENGILTRASEASKKTGQASAEEQVQLEVTASIGTDGNINIEDLNDNLGNIEGLTHEGDTIENNPIDNLPATVVVDGYEILIGADGSVGEVIRMEDYQTAETKPYLPSSSFTQVEGTSLENGLVVTDGTNYWTWIEVPTNIYENATYNEGTAPTGANDYDSIDKVLNNYAATLLSRNNFDDVWYDYYGTTYDGENEYSQVTYITDSDKYNSASKYYGTLYTDRNGTVDSTKNYVSGTTYYAKITEKLNDTNGCGLTYEEYNNLKNKMLSSVYKNGGFWIGQYEAGSNVVRTSSSALTIPIIQQNAYPYNYITCSNAQIQSSKINSGDYTSSLMFGIQWNLVLKHLQIHGATSEELTINSSNWGNYSDSQFPVTYGSKYAIYNNWSLGEWADVPVNYNKPSSNSSGNGVLLSTGASDQNSKMHIYDLAGNVSEWILEKNSNANYPCSYLGGFYGNDGTYAPASNRVNAKTSFNNLIVSFRIALY